MRDGRRATTSVRFGSDRDVSLRLRSTDFETFKQVTIDAAYDMQHRPPRFIVDAGANIGLFTLALAARFPRTQIVAIEPDPQNYELLCSNVAALPQVTALQAAIVPNRGTVHLTDPGLGEWGYRVADGAARPEDIAVDGVDVPWLLERFKVSAIDILKVDIEGGEKELFESAGPWIDRVNMVIAEMHDRFRPGCSRAFFNATRDFEVEKHHGEHIFMCRQSFLSA